MIQKRFKFYGILMVFFAFNMQNLCAQDATVTVNQDAEIDQLLALKKVTSSSFSLFG